MYVNNVLPLYFQSLRSAKKSGDYTNADNLLESLKGYQKRYGEMIVPSDSKIKSEILYNKYDVFKKIFSWYLYAGLLLFLILIIQIFNQKKVFVYLINFFKAVVYLLFVLHTAGLIFRAYISGHAPWSDAYESMIYVSWATMLFGNFVWQEVKSHPCSYNICCIHDFDDCSLELDGSIHSKPSTCS